MYRDILNKIVTTKTVSRSDIVSLNGSLPMPLPVELSPMSFLTIESDDRVNLVVEAINTIVKPIPNFTEEEYNNLNVAKHELLHHAESKLAHCDPQLVRVIHLADTNTPIEVDISSDPIKSIIQAICVDPESKYLLQRYNIDPTLGAIAVPTLVTLMNWFADAQYQQYHKTFQTLQGVSYADLNNQQIHYMNLVTGDLGGVYTQTLLKLSSLLPEDVITKMLNLS